MADNEYASRLLAEIREQLETMTSPAEFEDEVVTFACLVSNLDQALTYGAAIPEQWVQSDHRQGRPRRTVDGPVLDNVTHGKRESYRVGCRCVPCTAANRVGRNLTPAELANFG
jgi:hypothetical protein